MGCVHEIEKVSVKGAFRIRVRAPHEKPLAQGPAAQLDGVSQAVVSIQIFGPDKRGFEKLMAAAMEKGMTAQFLIQPVGGFPDKTGVGQGDLCIMGRFERALINTSFVGQKLDFYAGNCGFQGQDRGLQFLKIAVQGPVQNDLSRRGKPGGFNHIKDSQGFWGVVNHAVDPGNRFQLRDNRVTCAGKPLDQVKIREHDSVQPADLTKRFHLIKDPDEKILVQVKIRADEPGVEQAVFFYPGKTRKSPGKGLNIPGRNPDSGIKRRHTMKTEINGFQENNFCLKIIRVVRIRDIGDGQFHVPHKKTE